jgi:ferredoxin
MLGWISKLAIFRRQVTGECKDCALCARDCPVGTIRADRGYASDPSECTVCMQCLGSCKLKGNAFRATRQPASWSEYDPSRREALQTFGVALTAVALAGSEPLPTRVNPHYILPPGGLDNDLVAKCIRCGECLRVCPTAGLQPALFEAGWVGMSTPLLVSRLGYCDYSCNACGQTCPVQAIPSLSLEEKRTTVIGLAYINQNRCIAWSDHQNCIVCQEMCPLPDKAVYLLPGTFTNPDGSPAEVKLPYVNRSLCIGCGICENKCPVRGEAAIRVFTPGTPV